MATPFKRITQALTISTTQYTADDTIGGLLTFDIGDLPAGSLLNKVVLVDDDNEKAALELWLFNASPTTPAVDNAAATLLIADLKKVITTVSIPTTSYRTTNSNAIAVITDINDLIVGNALYGYLLPTATPTYTATTDLWLALEFVPQPSGKG